MEIRKISTTTIKRPRFGAFLLVVSRMNNLTLLDCLCETHHLAKRAGNTAATCQSSTLPKHHIESITGQ